VVFLAHLPAEHTARAVTGADMGTFTKPANEFKDIPLVKTHTMQAASMVGSYATEQFTIEIEQRLRGNFPEGVFGDPSTYTAALEFDSPLETVFWIWWRAAGQVDHFCEHNIHLRRHVETETAGHRYVVDFVVANTRHANGPYIDEHWPLIGIELDGHAFHEKTPEQVTYRNQRDRALQQAGWHMFHFSFSEFTRNPQDAIWEVVEFARATYWQLVKQHSPSATKG
jgi:very-short-patch-repair endonuclease